MTGVGIFLLVLGSVWWVTSRTEESIDHRLPVSATFYPVAFLAEQIGGDLVAVRTVVPPGIEPHDFDPSLRDIADMYRSKLILINGAGVDMWAEKLEEDFSKRGVPVIVLSRSVDLMDATEDEEGRVESHGVKDPHFWLDPIAYRKSGEAVLQGLIGIDPAHAAIYRANFARFERNLLAIDAHLQELSSSRCRLDIIIVSHDAFSYLARQYGFKVRSLAGINPEQEVSVGELADVIRLMRERHIRYVLNEPLGNMDMATTIGKETGATVLAFNPLEGLFPSELAAGENYFSVMDTNWITLRKALECE